MVARQKTPKGNSSRRARSLMTAKASISIRLLSSLLGLRTKRVKEGALAPHIKELIKLIARSTLWDLKSFQRNPLKTFRNLLKLDLQKQELKESNPLLNLIQVIIIHDPLQL
jgi:hypothetical protein